MRPALPRSKAGSTRRPITSGSSSSVAARPNDVMTISSSEAATVTNRPRGFARLRVFDAARHHRIRLRLPYRIMAARKTYALMDCDDDPQSANNRPLLYRDGVKIGSPAGTTFTDTNVLPGKNYSYQVSAVNALATRKRADGGGFHQISQNLSAYTLTLSTRDSFLPGVPVLVQSRNHWRRRPAGQRRVGLGRHA